VKEAMAKIRKRKDSSWIRTPFSPCQIEKWVNGYQENSDRQRILKRHCIIYLSLENRFQHLSFSFLWFVLSYMPS
jgi:hypothetical protein